MLQLQNLRRPLRHLLLYSVKNGYYGDKDGDYCYYTSDLLPVSCCSSYLSATLTNCLLLLCVTILFRYPSMA